MDHRFQCRCGTVQGEIRHARRGVRAVCHCRDCQAYAHVLGEPAAVLDAAGGTDIVASDARSVRFTAGTDSLACLSLSPRGLLRWYARCCGTPIANTPRDAHLPYAGFVHTVLERPDPMERTFGPPLVHVNARSARGPTPKRRPLAGWARFLVLMGRLNAARLTGSWRRTPFFDAQGAPVAPVDLVPRERVEQARREVAAAGAGGVGR